MSKITSKMKRHVRHVLKEEKPTIWIGKDGLTPSLIDEVEKQIQKNKMVKIRILPTALSNEITADVIAERTAEAVNGNLVEVRGRVFILYRKRRKILSERGATQDKGKS